MRLLSCTTKWLAWLLLRLSWAACHACRAPKPAMPDVGSFEDILAQARQQAAPPAAAEPAGCAPDGEQGAGGEQQGAAAGEQAAAAAGAGAEEEQAAGEEDGSCDGDDLLIMSSDEEGGGGGDVRLVELPSTTKKANRMPFIRTQVGRTGGGSGAVCRPAFTRAAGPTRGRVLPRSPAGAH